MRHLRYTDLGCTVSEFVVLLLFAGYFLFYGLIPIFGGDQLGLVGADEPRYAQIAREMLAAHSADCHAVHARIVPRSLRPADLHASYVCLMGGTVTPILYGKPWLEKPALYYWRAMGFYKELGVYDWTARLPSGTGSLALILLAFLHLKRFRPGGHLDAALIMVSAIAMFAFSRGASTDMQLAAPFCIGMLGWYAWYETGKKFWLFDLYFFGAAATLAKGPVAPFLALAIICLFLGLRREWSALRRTIWIPGILLYLAMVLPWYIAVQRRNPTFFNEFFWKHNLERYTTNIYQHHQPFYYYLVVLILGLMPWTALALAALVDGLETSIDEWKVRFKPQRYVGHVRAGDAFPEFLVLWALFPILFFSFSGSKLPGYILPAIPPITILTGDYLYRRRQPGLNRWILIGHALVCGAMTMAALLLPWFVVHGFVVHGAAMPPAHAIAAASLAAFGAALLILVVTKGFGVAQLRPATCWILVVLVLFLYGVGPFFGIPGVDSTKRVIHLLDRSYSARPLAERIGEQVPATETIAVFRVRRDAEFGLSFYRNREVVNYDESGVPDEQHVLVARIQGRHGVDLDTQLALSELLEGRQYEQLFAWPEQGLEVYLVGSK